MKIERGYGEYNADRYQQKRTVESQPTQESQTHLKPAAVKLSETAQKIRENHNVVQGNSEKIAAIKKAIQEGTYQVSPSEIAESMWQQMKDQ